MLKCLMGSVAGERARIGVARNLTGWVQKTERAATMQQKAKGRRITRPVLLPLTAGDGI